MTHTPSGLVGFTCRYTPLPLIHAAGLIPYRILPTTEADDQAGAVLHDNLCGHVKRVLDRAMANDLPELAGLVIVNSCDAMRRLAGAWRQVRPDDPVVVVDLPAGRGALDAAYLARELRRLRRELEAWSGVPVTDTAIRRSAELYGRLARRLDGVAVDHTVTGGRARLQELVIRAVTSPPEEVLASFDEMPPSSDSESGAPGVPVLLVGNVLPDPAALEMLEGCGIRIVDDDLCTGSRQLIGFDVDGEDPLAAMASQLLESPPCARSLDAAKPGELGDLVVERARRCGARGVIAHVLKFCDPYLVRVPGVQEALRAASVPFLLLEGDCSLRAIGQQRTRIEAFVEMLGGSA